MREMTIAATTEREATAGELRACLTRTPRQLPAHYFYDAVGSALFDAICELPWYPITRAERTLLEACGQDIWRLARPSAIVELGSGSGGKLQTLLAAGDTRARGVHVHVIDLSRSALRQSLHAVSSIDGVHATAHCETYERGMAESARAFPADGAALVLFLGSNIGNFDRGESRRLLRDIRASLRPGDSLLLGADLVKPREVLELAYDDPPGVTAAFNRNILARVNREWGGDFEVSRFAHSARWNERESRVEMHLAATRDECIHLAGLNLTFGMRAGETIWTESSYKFEPSEITALLEESGFRRVEQWLEGEDRFSLTLARTV